MSEELRRLRHGPAPGERPGGLGTEAVSFTTSGDAAELIARIRHALLPLIELPDAEFDERAPDVLPAWLRDAFIPERTPQEQQRYLAWWRSLDREGKARAEDELPWTLENWLYWMSPEERPWRWWDAAATDTGGTVWIEVDGWPVPIGALEWVIRAAGGRIVRDTRP